MRKYCRQTKCPSLSTLLVCIDFGRNDPGPKRPIPKIGRNDSVSRVHGCDGLWSTRTFTNSYRVNRVLLSLTGTVPLHIKRMKSMACEVFKIVNDLSPKYIQDLVNIKVSNYNFRNDQQATLPKVNSTSYIRTEVISV